ncbi:carboxymuconolactone decarboxylase [Mycolicibacterium conceptionense]|uniref:Carboxymuconolactone decarboxylase n=1 Tax=Mycolicibacterium conceptionense TaxID=451644 RepID=A0A1A0PD95_9MYCO|nr:MULTISPECIES: carboxymuconolactone decarboxylase family protein [Mycolicibacterium]MCW1820257.1 carboxymuconolactone decarboxylase family protein [Mycolicibacterium senegalense]OBB07234.1 carboxymuconolactone decarboxylase [Mycolicibacterium conceptionense]OBF02779.1 carboxymuconolactone decarboxylase [Mycolicibacterium conceptionense]OBF23377.1 carboxymuconolactone decarboxylase [Mycolicibacterium conceptionense]OBF35326.1 carboxymuconolactone decarboxylase [Mycolicibacterium conceptionens
MSRVAPLAPPWSEEDAAGIQSWGHPDRTYESLLLVRCLQRHPKLAAKLRKLGEALYVDTLLPPRVRTIAILRICALVGCAYEWGGQAAFWGPIAGVSDAECDALVTGADAGWSAAERVLIDAVDELERTGSWSATTWEAFGDDLDEEQRMELLIAVGWYRTICTLCNGLDLPVEAWMRPWPGSAV